VETGAAEQQARSAFADAGIDPGRVEFIRGDLWSMWTRDWGPQAVFDGDGELAYADPWFDGYPWVPGCEDGPVMRIGDRRRGRGYEEDDALPAVVAAHLDVPLAPLPAYLTGGNVMTDGLGIAWSTRQMLAENAPYLDEDAFRAQAAAVMGIGDYRLVIDPEVHGIQHIDCYAKLLDEETVLVKEVPAWHPEAACCDDVAAAFAGALTCYGRPYEVVRIFCDVYEGSSAAAYTNSLILNGKVLVPMFGIEADHAALATYQDAMPGYEVLGFPYGGWYDYDALHCRTMGLFDPGMLRLLHAPVDPVQPAGSEVAVAAWCDDRSGAGLDGPPLVRWRLAGEVAWSEVALASVDADSFVGAIPAQPAGAEVEYQLVARDLSGRLARLPRGDGSAVFAFTADAALSAPVRPSALALTAAPNPFNPRTELRLTVPAASRCRLEIVDLRGRRIRTLVDGVAPRGGRVAWDGADHAGRAQPSGVYLAVLEVEGRRTSLRLVLQR
ncbi:hypothetical protein GF314_12830, partial [bacterium]|nr:hypothetical protein [bacterium]